jgi:hypothetical protein
MKVVCADPAGRLPNLVTDVTRYGFPNLMVNLPRYWCPHCGEYTAFSVGELKQTPLDPDAYKLFEAQTELTTHEQAVTDFLCRVCSRPVRLIYRYNEHHMASYYYFAETVLETA